MVVTSLVCTSSTWAETVIVDVADTAASTNPPHDGFQNREREFAGLPRPGAFNLCARDITGMQDPTVQAPLLDLNRAPFSPSKSIH